MDPLSITVSVTALLECIIQLHKGIQSVRSGGQEREKLLSELRLMHDFLHGLQGQLQLVQGKEAWMKPILELDEPDGVFDQLRSALAQLMIKLGAKPYPSNEKATPIDGRRTFRSRFIEGVRWSLNAQDVHGVCQRIERLKSTMALALGQSNVLLGQSNVALSQSNLSLAKETSGDILALKREDEEQRLRSVIDWLSPLNFREKQRSIRGVANTGRWFFERKEFSNWIEGREPVLWCYGIPGAGKTILASTTADRLHSLHEEQTAAVLIAFCSYDEPDAQMLDVLLASLMKQALQISPKWTPELESTYNHHRKEQSRPSSDEICTLLRIFLSQFERTFVVIDGLDELKSTADRELLLHHVQNLGQNVRLMVTSRRYDDIVALFGRPFRSAHQCDACEKRLASVYYYCEKCQVDKCPPCYDSDATCCETGSLTKKNACKTIKIAAHPEDVENFILQRVRSAPLLPGFIVKRKVLRDEILSTVRDKAKEMFLLARLYMDNLEEKLTSKQVQTALSHLPEELDGTYDQAIQRINELKGPLQKMVKDLILWVAYARRPLRTTEIEHALAISPDVEDIDEDDVTDITLLTSKCAGLVEIDEAKYLRLTHETVENYVGRNKDSWYPGGESVVADRCLAYLRMNAFSKGACSGPTEEADFKKRCASYPFLPYASVFWGDHVHDSVKSTGDSVATEQGRGGSTQDDGRIPTQTGEAPSVIPSSMKFLKSSGHLDTVVQSMWYNDPRWDAKYDVTAVHLTAWFGLLPQTKRLLSKGVEVNAKDSLGTTPLMYAPGRGHSRVNEVLLQSHASTSMLCYRGSTALHRASLNGRPKVVQQLLEHDDASINVLSRQRRNFSALMLAIVNNHVEVVKRLLARDGIDINLQSGRVTALLLATSRCRLDIVKLLLAHPEVRINHQDSYGYTALNLAAENGHVPIIEVLMDHGADSTLRDVLGGAPLLRATDEGRVAVVRTLIKRGVDYTCRDFRGRTVLHGAAINNRHKILSLLLQIGANKLDVNSQGESGETPMHDAARCGHVESMRVLLEFGARTDIQDHAHRTPIDSASIENRLEVLQMLKEARDEGSVSKAKSQDLVKAHRLDPTEVPAASDTIITEPLRESYKRPFYKAVQVEEVTALEALLPSSFQERTTLLDERDPESGASALHHAVRYNRPDVVHMLLEAGANPGAANYYGHTALHLAALHNRVGYMEDLIKHGVGIDFDDYKDYTSLKVAVLHGSREAALCLIEKGAVIRKDNPYVHILIRWAAELGHVQAIRRLVSFGATFQLKGEDGQSPYEIARDKGHVEVAQLLLKETIEYRERREAAVMTAHELVDDPTIKSAESSRD